MSAVGELMREASVLLAVLFAVSAAAKARSPRSSFALVGEVTAGRLARPLVITTIGAEIVVATALVVQPRVGGGLALTLIAVLSVFAAAGARRAPGVGCTCFGPRSAPIGAATFVRNALIGGAALAVALSSDATLTVMGMATAAGLMVLAAVIVAAVEMVTATGSLFGEVDRIRKWDVPAVAGTEPGGAA
jgi:hypothetical protein